MRHYDDYDDVEDLDDDRRIDRWRRRCELYGALPPGLDDRFPGSLDGGPLPSGPAYGYGPYDDRRADAEFIAGATALILEAILLSRRG